MRTSLDLPCVSVVITTFNRSQFLVHAIESVLTQDFKDLELIVVNDASTDSETEKCIVSYKDARICYIKNNKNVGSAKSLNIGLQAARGDYIAILDDDDEWISKEKLREQIKFLVGNSDHVLIGTNVVIVDYVSRREITRTFIPQRDADLRKNLLKTNPIAHSSAVYRRDVALSVGGYDESLPRGKDYDLWLKLAQKGKISVLPQHYLMYRETTFKRKNFIKMRKKDAKAVMAIQWKYRRDYSGFLASYLISSFRFLTFSLLEIVQRIIGVNE